MSFTLPPPEEIVDQIQTKIFTKDTLERTLNGYIDNYKSILIGTNELAIALLQCVTSIQSQFDIMKDSVLNDPNFTYTEQRIIIEKMRIVFDENAKAIHLAERYLITPSQARDIVTKMGKCDIIDHIVSSKFKAYNERIGNVIDVLFSALSGTASVIMSVTHKPPH